MIGYLLSPIASQPGGGVAFSVLTLTLNPVFGTSDTVCHGYITCADGIWHAHAERNGSTHGYPHPDLAARAVIA